MEIKGATILVLGGYGEVGSAVCRLVLLNQPRELIVTSLREEEVQSALSELSRDCMPGTTIRGVSGNLFFRREMKDKTLFDVSKDHDLLRKVVDDNMHELTEEILTSSLLFNVITEHRPDIIVDCITTATALAYRNVYHQYEELSQEAGPRVSSQDHVDPVLSILITIALPPLIRHVQILYEAMKRANTRLYLKIGTTGTGGMGLNIPFTHGEESPSRLLMTKAAVAGAHTMLLLLLSKTPGGPIIKEIKPAAMIGWKGINSGKIRKGGKPVRLFDCVPQQAYRLVSGNTFRFGEIDPGFSVEEESLQGTYVDTGENGVFSVHEFTLLTSLGLMEFVTPEEIAHNAIRLIKGTGSPKDVVGAVEGAIMDPTYRAGFLRESVVKRMKSLGSEGVSYGLLGPSVSKFIFEAHLIKNVFSTAEQFLSVNAQDAAYALERSLSDDNAFRQAALSIGLPILLPDGEHILFARRGIVDKAWEQKPWEISRETINTWASREWIDLRPENIMAWQKRFQSIVRERQSMINDSSSRFDRGEAFWQLDGSGNTIIDPGEFVAWVLIHEFEGGRSEAYRES